MSSTNEGKLKFFFEKYFEEMLSFSASSPKNLLPLRLDERKDCEFSLPFHYEGDTSSNPGM
jgi:hypothetical protein